ncbi:MAG TPA: response regulator transcription factor [Sphingomicrobium sp.]|nr:response regulator transcription factor [Sphingomicrobium sp.]
MKRILLADDHPMIRNAIEVLLRDSGFEIVGMAGTGQATLEAMERLQPDLLLLDIQMPDGNGIEVLRRLRASRSDAKVVLLTAAIDDSALLEARALKVQGIVLKNSDPAFLLDCLESVAAGRQWLDPELKARSRQLASAPARRIIPLAPRERELIACVRKGLRNREIAEQLGVTEGTVKVYLHAIFEKLGVGNRTELAIRADELLGTSP